VDEFGVYLAQQTIFATISRASTNRVARNGIHG